MTTITDLDDFKALDTVLSHHRERPRRHCQWWALLRHAGRGRHLRLHHPTPGYPRHVEGREAIAELYRPYGTTIVLDRCHDLAVHHDMKTGVVLLEYASEGRVLPTGAPYTNRYISVLTITNRKVTHWRDYLDPVAVF